MEPNVLGIYSRFEIYFLIDTNTKMWTEITDLVVFRKKLLKFLQGVQFCRPNSEFTAMASTPSRSYCWPLIREICKENEHFKCFIQLSRQDLKHLFGVKNNNNWKFSPIGLVIRIAVLILIRLQGKKVSHTPPFLDLLEILHTIHIKNKTTELMKTYIVSTD